MNQPTTTTPRPVTVFELRSRAFAELVENRCRNSTPEAYNEALDWVAERLLTLGCESGVVTSCRDRHALIRQVDQAIRAQSIRYGVINTGWEVRVGPSVLGWAVADDEVAALLDQLHTADRITIEADGTVTWQ